MGFGLLEFIREYALEKLREAPQEAGEMERLHTLYFMRLAEEAEGLLAEALQKYGVDKLEWERDNMRTSLRWASRESKVETGSSADLPSPSATEIALRTARTLAVFCFIGSNPTLLHFDAM